MTQTYRLVSVKGTETISGTIQEAIDAAIAHEERLQPAFGVSVEDETGATVADIRDGRDIDADDDEA